MRAGEQPAALVVDSGGMTASYTGMVSLSAICLIIAATTARLPLKAAGPGPG